MHRLRVRHFAALLSAAAALVAASPPLLAQTAPPRTENRMPSDIDPNSGFRLPLLKREELDEAARKTYDSAMTPGETIVGLRGPAGVQLYSPRTTQHLRAINRYLRFEAGISPRIREIAILATARELDSQFEWAAHEAEALRQGIAPEIIDTVRYRRTLDGLDEADAVVVALGRELFGARKVSSATYARCLEHFGQRKLVDLVALMGNYAATAALLTAFDMQLDPGTEPGLPLL